MQSTTINGPIAVKGLNEDIAGMDCKKAFTR
jgi:hypothetical protein